MKSNPHKSHADDLTTDELELMLKLHQIHEIKVERQLLFWRSSGFAGLEHHKHEIGDQYFTEYAILLEALHKSRRSLGKLILLNKM